MVHCIFNKTIFLSGEVRVRVLGSGGGGLGLRFWNEVLKMIKLGHAAIRL